MHQGRTTHCIAGIHLDLLFQQATQGPGGQFVVVVLARQHEGPFVFPRLWGIGMPSLLLEELHERGKSLHAIRYATSLIDPDGKGRHPFCRSPVGIGSSPEQHRRDFGLAPLQRTDQRRFARPVVHFAVVALRIGIDSSLQQGFQCFPIPFSQHLEEVHPAGLHREFIKRILTRKQGAHPFGSALHGEVERTPTGRVLLVGVDLPTVEQQCRRRITAHLFRLELLQLLAGLPLLLLRDPSFAEAGDKTLLAGNLPCGIGGAAAENVQGIVAVAVRGVEPLPGVDQHGGHRVVTVLHGLEQRRRAASRTRKVRSATQQQPCRRGNRFFQSGYPAAA